MPAELLLSDVAQKQLKKLDPHERHRVLSMLQRLREGNEVPLLRLQGMPESSHEWFVMRMGKYRVVFRRIEENEARGVGTPPGQRLLVAAVIPRDHLIDFIGDTQT